MRNNDTISEMNPRHTNLDVEQDILTTSAALMVNVCEDCSSLPIREAFDKQEARETSRGLPGDNSTNAPWFVADLRLRFRNAFESECPLCKQLSQMARRLYSSPNYKIELGDVLWLCAEKAMHFPSLGPVASDQCLIINLFITPAIENWAWLLYLWQRETGYIACYDQNCPPPSEHEALPSQLPQRFDASRVVQWLKICKRTHDIECSGAVARLRNLRCIDCHRRKVSTMYEAAEYLTLSYVWGSETSTDALGPPDINGDAALPETLPNVVEDAIELTLTLGYSYLWVDKYCIDQHNSDIEQAQIRQMDTVYANSELTLVAAAGDDQNYGLPGLSSRPRKRQNTACIDGIRLFGIDNDVGVFISCSKWNSRGWTYQEGVCSRRRLVFLDDQVYFECNNMAFCEQMQTNPDTTLEMVSPRIDGWHGMWSDARWNSKQNANWSDKPDCDETLALYRFRRAVEEFSRRELRYDKDALAAFTGIMSRFRHASIPILEVCGICFPDDSRPHVQYRAFLSSLLWEQGHPGVRRHCLPSWSWAGWDVVTRMRRSYGIKDDALKSRLDMIQFSHSTRGAKVEDADDNGVSIPSSDPSARWDLVRSKDFMHQQPQVLWLHGCEIPHSAFSNVRFSNVPSKLDQEHDVRRMSGPKAILDITRGDILMPTVVPKNWHFLLLLSSVEKGLLVHYGLILEELETGAYSREGTFRLPEESKDTSGNHEQVKQSWPGMLEDRGNWKTFQIV